ncbi:MAG: DUF308 domain-containing protein [Clostridia bacterium]|nr:DUF308 domain-containing protein [Clostridia bacterium]
MKSDKKINSIVLCIAELLVGILLLIKPVGFTSGIIICAGVAMMVKGIIDVVAYFRTPAQAAAQQKRLSTGLIALLIGAFCAFRYQWLMSAVPFLGIIYAVILLLLGVEKIQTAVDQRRLGNAKWYIVAIAALISIVCALIIFLNPFSVATYLWVFTGISLIVEALADIVSFVMNMKKA